MSFRSHRSAVHPYPTHSNGHSKSHLTASNSHAAAMTPRPPFVEVPQSAAGASASASAKSQSILHRPASRSSAATTSRLSALTATRHGPQRSAVAPAPPLASAASVAKAQKLPFRGKRFFFAEEKDGDDSQVTALGGEIQVFFSKAVTHLIVPDAIKAQLPALLSASAASASGATVAPTELLLKARPPIVSASASASASASTAQSRSGTMAKMVQDAVSFGAEVLGITELNHQVRLHTGRLTASAHPSTLTNSHAHAHAHGGHARAHHARSTAANPAATTTAGYVHIPNTNYRLRPLQAPYLLVLDKLGHFRPCILKEYADAADLPRLHRTPQESILSPFQRSSQHAPPIDPSLPGNGVVRPAPAKPNPSLVYLPANPGQPPTEFQLQTRLAQEGARVSSKVYEESHLHADLDALRRSERVVRAVLPHAAPRASYCEWCGLRYDNMVEHMASATHQGAIRQPGAWRELDLMIRTYGRKYVEPPGVGPVGRRIASAGKGEDAGGAGAHLLSSPQPDVVLDLGFVFDDEEEEGIMSDEQVPLEVPPAYEQQTQSLGAQEMHDEENEDEMQVHESPLAAKHAHQRSRRPSTVAKPQTVFEWNDDQASDDVFGGDDQVARRPATANNGHATHKSTAVRHAAPSTLSQRSAASNSSAAASLLRSHSQSQMQSPPLSQSAATSRLVIDVANTSDDMLDPEKDPIVSTHASLRSRASLTASGTGAAPGPRPATATPISVPQTMPPPASALASTSSRRSASGNGFASAAAVRTPAPAPATSTSGFGTAYSNWYPSTGYFNLNASGLTPATSQSYSTTSSAATTTLGGAGGMYGYTPTPKMPGMDGVHPQAAAGGFGSAAPAALWEYDRAPGAARQPPVGTSRQSAPPAMLSVTVHAGHTPGPRTYLSGAAADAAAAAMMHMPVMTSPDIVGSFFKGGARPASAARAGERVDAGGGANGGEDAAGSSEEMMSLTLSMSAAGGESVGERAPVSESTLGDFVLTSTGPGRASGGGGDHDAEDEDEAHRSFKSPLRSGDMHMFRSETSTSGNVFGDFFDDEEEEESVLDHARGTSGRSEGGAMATTTDENKCPDDEFAHVPSPMSVGEETQTDEDLVQDDQAPVGGATSEDSGSSPCRTAAKRAAKRRRGQQSSSGAPPPLQSRGGSGKQRGLAASAIAPMHWAATPANAGRSKATAASASSKVSKPIMYPTPVISGSTHDFDAADIAGGDRHASSSDAHVFDFDHMDDEVQEPAHKRQRLGSLRSRRGSAAMATVLSVKPDGVTQPIASPSVKTRARARAERESGKDLSVAGAVAPAVASVGRTTRHKLKQQQQQPLSVSKAAKSLPTPLTR